MATVLSAPTQWDRLTPHQQYRLDRLFRLVLRLRREGKLPRREVKA